MMTKWSRNILVLVTLSVILVAILLLASGNFPLFMSHEQPVLEPNQQQPASVQKRSSSAGTTTTEYMAEAPEGTTATSSSIAPDTIPAPSQVEGGYDITEIQSVVAQYLSQQYPNRGIASVQLLGNRVEPAHDTIDMLIDGLERASYMSYLVTLDDGTDVGLFVQCSESVAPNVVRTEHLIIDSTLMYDVSLKRYVPIVAESEPDIQTEGELSDLPGYQSESQSVAPESQESPESQLQSSSSQSSSHEFQSSSSLEELLDE